jgi:hypothetical protein
MSQLSQPSLLGALAMICIMIGVAIADDETLFPMWIPMSAGCVFGVAAFLTS